MPTDPVQAGFRCCLWDLWGKLAPYFFHTQKKKSSTDAVTALCYTLVTGQERERERGIQRTFILLVLNPLFGIQSALLFCWQISLSDTWETCVIGHVTPPDREFVQRHDKFVVVLFVCVSNSLWSTVKTKTAFGVNRPALVRLEPCAYLSPNEVWAQLPTHQN